MGEGSPRAVALIDGEHYPPVVVAALESLAGRFEIVAALFLGGAEKLPAAAPGADAGASLGAAYPVPLTFPPVPRGRGAAARHAALRAGLDALLVDTGAVAVVDLSDEPVLTYADRFQLISVAMARGARYVGADFEFSPQPLERLPGKPSLAVIGTGKRVGKTAISGYLARRLTLRYGDPARVAVVAMGRGGPPEPQVVRGAEHLGSAELLGASRRGLHAASDYFEDAVLAGVTTIGCRRCGGGMAGGTVDENVRQAVPLVAALPVDVVVWEGSGAAIPPVEAQAVVCVASAAQPPETTTGYLGTYRMLISDLIVLTMCESPYAGADDVRALCAGIAEVAPSTPVVPTVFRPRPAGEVAGRRVAFFSTADAGAMPGLVACLEREYGAEVVVASPDLGDRVALADAVGRASGLADLFLTEIKAAAIDVVAEGAAAAGIELMFCDNQPVALGDDDLAAAVDRLIETAVGRAAATEAR